MVYKIYAILHRKIHLRQHKQKSLRKNPFNMPVQGAKQDRGDAQYHQSFAFLVPGLAKQEIRTTVVAALAHKPYLQVALVRSRIEIKENMAVELAADTQPEEDKEQAVETRRDMELVHKQLDMEQA